jgi:hypothetical protein
VAGSRGFSIVAAAATTARLLLLDSDRSKQKRAYPPRPVGRVRCPSFVRPAVTPLAARLVSRFVQGGRVIGAS